MRVEKFEDIVAWQKAGEMAVLIYGLFEKNTDFGFRDQIRRASVSIMNNIGEGFERKSNKEFIRFLYIAKGSCGEVRSMLYLALKFGYISDKQFVDFRERSIEISKILAGFIKSI